MAKMSQRLVLACTGLLLLANGLAQASDFTQGVTAFKAQDYALAIVHFEQARAQGLDKPVLHYNLAVSYFKQQRYDLARQSFELAAKQDSLAAISHYNLGLVALKQDDQETAQQAFKQSFNLAQDERLKLLAARRLEDLLPPEQPRQTAVPAKRISGILSLGLAHDSNVSRVNDDLPTIEASSDSFLDLFAQVNLRLTGTRRQGMSLKLGVMKMAYQDLTTYNQQTLNAGLYYKTPLSDWRTRIGLHYYRDELNGQAFQRRLVGRLRADSYYYPGQRLRLRYDLSQYEEQDPVYEYLAGFKHLLQAENRSRFGNEQLRIGYKFEVNDRDDLRSANSFISVSPIRHTLYAKWRHDFSKQFTSELALEYRDSDYQQNNKINGVAEAAQLEQRSRASVAASYQWTKNLELEARWRYTNNDANLANERYSNHLYSVTANLYF